MARQRSAIVRGAASIGCTGPGIPDELRARLFQPYVRGHDGNKPGIGLGLATVHRIAESHGGSVGVRSSEAGSVFWLELPIVDDVLPDHDGHG